MSYYYNYYAGYEHDNKIYPLGPYNASGRIKPIISKSRSFASELHQSFRPIREEEITDELRKDFECEDWDGKRCVPVKVLPVRDLPKTDFVKTGYFLIKDVEAYEKDEDGDFEGFWDRLSPQVYAAKLEKELKFGQNKPQKDECGNEYTEHNASEYMFYAYPDYDCEEYESFMILSGINMLNDYQGVPEGAKLIVLETEG